MGRGDRVPRNAVVSPPTGGQPWVTLPGLLFAGAAGAAAAQHPVSPELALFVLSVVVAWAMFRPADLWLMLPALLPIANFTPWTGWWLVDESDLLVLAAMGGAYMRWGIDGWRKPTAMFNRTPRSMQWVYVALPPVLLMGVWRGLDDARGVATWTALLEELWNQGFYGDFDLPGNTLRVAKSLAWGLLLMPVLYRSSQGAPQRLARGMLAGLFLVCAGVLWERCVYVGLLDFNDRYRITAWFWEMHVGGGAVDAYLALALPFAWWAAWSAPRGWRWYASAVLVLLAIHAVLTTYSRGVYLSVALTSIALAILAHKYRFVAPDDSAWHRWAMACLLVALMAETLGVLKGGAFMSDRLARSNADLYQRIAHWQRGLGLLNTPGQWVGGLGAGRFPAYYSTHTVEGALPGRVRWTRDADGSFHVWLSGPTRSGVKGSLGLAQRVALTPDEGYRVRLRGRMESPMRLQIQLCEQHLLYAFQCQIRTHLLGASNNPANGWIDLPLLGTAFASHGIRSAWRDGILSVAVLEAKEPIRLDAVELIDPEGRQVLKNSTFALGPRYWSRIAYENFLPWHTDNLLLELLVEWGLFGLIALTAVAAWALVMAVQGIGRHQPLALFVMGSISAIFLIGGVVSVIEFPRVSTMLWLLLVVSPLVREGALPERKVLDGEDGLSGDKK